MASAFLRIFLVSLVLLTTVVVKNIMDMTKPLPIPELDPKRYWGPGSAANYKEDPTIKPFKIAYTSEILDLKDHLSRPLKLAAPLEGVGFEYGINTNYLRTLVKYWRDDYLPRWTDRQNYLNSFPQYKTKIQGLDIHFIHIKPQQKSKDILPLILLHGWPGSVREYYGLISELISGNHEKYDFELIVPSLPGFGWSQASSKKGLSPSAMAVIFKNLMKRLGHEKFLIQGGDFGAIIGSHLATLYPDSVIGVHSNMCGVNGPSSVFKWMFASVFPTWFVTSEQISFHFPISSYLSKVIEETGHLHIHSTKPDTIGTVFSRNPVGLLAYFVEKFATWTNPEFKKFEDGNLEKKFKLDDLFDNIMIYYLTNSITTSQRIYAESFAKTEMALQLDNIPTKVPYGCARFKHEMLHSLDWQLEDKYKNLIHSTYHLDGGHFAAFELPKVFYKDFIEFVEKVFSVKVKNEL